MDIYRNQTWDWHYDWPAYWVRVESEGGDCDDLAKMFKSGWNKETKTSEVIVKSDACCFLPTLEYVLCVGGDVQHIWVE